MVILSVCNQPTEGRTMRIQGKDWFPVRGYWKNNGFNGLYNMDDYGNLYRVRRWEVLGRNFCSNYFK